MYVEGKNKIKEAIKLGGRPKAKKSSVKSTILKKDEEALEIQISNHSLAAQ
jgi:hypothetical protein